MPTTWRLRAWDDPRLEQRFLDEDVIGMSSDALGDLSMHPTDDDLREWLHAAHPERSDRAIATFVRYWRVFLTEMEVDDLVVVPLRKSRYALGTITGPYRYMPEEPDPRLRHRRAVEWLQEGPRSEVADTVRRVLGSPGTVCRVKAGWPGT
ncbi:MAG: restriction endonuclease [Actinomycetia bacterium]|nr:restriction endonuclease [Actinomycetes bacterium]